MGSSVSSKGRGYNLPPATRGTQEPKISINTLSSSGRMIVSHFQCTCSSFQLSTDEDVTLSTAGYPKAIIRIGVVSWSMFNAELILLILSLCGLIDITHVVIPSSAAYASIPPAASPASISCSSG